MVSALAAAQGFRRFDAKHCKEMEKGNQRIASSAGRLPQRWHVIRM